MDPSEREVSAVRWGVAKRVALAFALALGLGATTAGAIGGIAGAAARGWLTFDHATGSAVVIVGGAAMGALTGPLLGWFACAIWAPVLGLAPARFMRPMTGFGLGALVAALASMVSVALSRAVGFPNDFSQWPPEWPWSLIATSAVGGAVAGLVFATALGRSKL